MRPAAALSGSSESTSWSMRAAASPIEPVDGRARRARSSARRPAGCAPARGGRRAASAGFDRPRGDLERRCASVSTALSSWPDSRSDAASVKRRAICPCEPAAVGGSWPSSSTSRAPSATHLRVGDLGPGLDAAPEVDRLLVGLDVTLADVLVRGRRRRARDAASGSGAAPTAAAPRRRRHRGPGRQAAARPRRSARASGACRGSRGRGPSCPCRARCAPSPSALRSPCRPARSGRTRARGARACRDPRVRLEADLQLRERLHPVARRVAARGRARPRCARGATSALWWSRRSRTLSASSRRPSFTSCPAAIPNSSDRAVDVLHARERLGEAQVRERVRRIELDDLAEDVDRLAVAVLALQARRDLVERGERVARQPELLIELGELRHDVRVPVFELRDVLGDDLADLLVDRDRLERETLAARRTCRRARSVAMASAYASILSWRSPIFSRVRASFGSSWMSFWYSMTALSYFFFSTYFWAASSTLSRSIATIQSAPRLRMRIGNGEGRSVVLKGAQCAARDTHGLTLEQATLQGVRSAK